MIATSPRQTTSPAPFIWILFLTALAFIILLAAPAIAHADIRHGSEASLARVCNERPEHMFFNPATGRTAFVCLVDGKFGVYVVNELGEEITSFVKNKMTKFDQVKHYLENVGYGFIQ